MLSAFPPTISIVFLAATLLFTAVGATPLPGDLEVAGRDLETRAVSPLSPEDIAGFAPFTQFARAAYCSGTQSWSCGGACSAVPEFQPTLTGGDGGSVPFFFVGYWPQQNSVIVSHEGTDPTQFEALLTDLNLGQVQLGSTLFPGLPDDIMVHNGFRDTHSASAPEILAEVKTLISTKNATSVISVGHSLGGAIAELDMVYFQLNLPSSVAIKGVTYGTPRVGNPAWADWFNSKVGRDFKRVNHHLDPVPVLPPTEMGYSHVSGEIHIDGSDNWNLCTGNDSEEEGCTIAEGLNINLVDHLGPYDGIFIGTPFCD